MIFFAVIAYNVLFAVIDISCPTAYCAVVAFAFSEYPIIIPLSLFISGNFILHDNPVVLHDNSLFDTLAPFPLKVTLYIYVSFFISFLKFYNYVAMFFFKNYFFFFYEVVFFSYFFSDSFNFIIGAYYQLVIVFIIV